MIAKQRDATRNRIAILESCQSPGMGTVQRQGIRQAAARLKADSTSARACAHIDSYFSDCDEWAVIHDLRIQHDSHILQINHLLVSASFDFYIIDSRYSKCALKVDASGKCWARSDGHSAVIASPLDKLCRDTRALIHIIKSTGILPRFLGLTPSISVHGFILTNPSLKTEKPASSLLDTSAVISSDMLFALLWEKRQSWLKTTFNQTDSSTLLGVAQSLSSHHKPSVPTSLTDTARVPEHFSLHQQPDTAHCAQCGKPVSAQSREYSFRNMDVFAGQVLCMKCQTV